MAISTSTSCIALAAALLGFSATAQAQSADAPVADESARDSGDIIVTANRRDQRLQDVPATVTAVTGQQIQDLKLLRVEDIAKLSPGLSLDAGSGGFRPNASIRGVGYDGNQGGQPVLDAYINDVPVDLNYALTAMYDVGQIEVLRGPQGTLRGRTSPSGAITITTRRPDTSEFGGMFQGTAATHDALNFQAAVNVPLIQDGLAVRVAGLVDRNRADNVRSVFNGVKPYSSTESARISVLATPADTLELLFTYQYLNARSRTYAQATGLGAGYNGPAIASVDRLSVQDEASTVSQRAHFASLQAKLSLPFDADLIYVGAYQDQRTVARNANDPGNSITNYEGFQELGIPVQYWTHELRLQSTGSGLISYVLGAYYNHGENQTTVKLPFLVYTDQAPGLIPGLLGISPFGVSGAGIFGLPGPANSGPVVNSFLVFPVNLSFAGEATTKAVFGNVTIRPTDRLEITGGLRYNNYSDPTNGFSESPLTYSGSIKYEVTPDINVYGSYGHSWRQRAGSVGIENNDNYPQLETLRVGGASEKSDSYEVGIKASFLDRRLQVNLSAYQQDFKNFLGFFEGVPYLGNSKVISGNLTAPVDARVRGVEFDASFRATPNWDISVIAAYAKSKAGNSLVPCRDGNGDGVVDSLVVGAAGSTGKGPEGPGSNPAGDLTDANPIAFCRANGAISALPQFSATVQSEYRVPFGANEAYFRALGAYRGSANNPSTLFQTKSYFLLDLFAGVRIGEMADLGIFAKNVTNTKVELSRSAVDFGSPIADPFLPATGYRLTKQTAQRQFGASVNFRW